jgi:hypothetical protein
MATTIEAPSAAESSGQTEPVIHDGFIIDPETGEVLGHIEKSGEFHVRDQESADWVLRKMLQAKTAIETVKANAEKLIRRHQRELDWLNLRFESELEELASRELKSQKTKTLQLSYGALAFRRVAPQVQATEDAIGWLEQLAPDAVKTTKSVLVSQIPEDVVTAAIAEERPGIFIRPERESFSIKLGGKSS